MPRAIKLQFRPYDSEICAVCSQWADDADSEPMQIDLEARLFLNAVFYSHGELGFSSILYESYCIILKIVLNETKTHVKLIESAYHSGLTEETIALIKESATTVSVQLTKIISRSKAKCSPSNFTKKQDILKKARWLLSKDPF